MADAGKIWKALSTLRGGANPEIDRGSEKFAEFLSQWDFFRREEFHRALGILLQYVEGEAKEPAWKAISELLVDFAERTSGNLTGEHKVGERKKKEVARETGDLRSAVKKVFISRLEKAKDPAKELDLLIEGLKKLEEAFPPPVVEAVKPEEKKPAKPLEEKINEAAAGLKGFRETHLKRTRKPRRSIWSRIRERFSQSDNDNDRARRFRKAVEEKIERRPQ